MQKFIALCVLALVFLQARAQKIIEKDVPLGPNGSVKLDIQIADSIRILTWSKNEVSVKGSVNVNDNKDNDNYQVTYSGSGNSFEMKTRLESPEHGKNNGNNCCCNNVQANFTIYIPENADLSIETINGNITITGRTAAVRAHSISGYVDLAIAAGRKADLKLRTITGTMYSDVDLPVTKNGVRQVGGDIDVSLNGGGRSIDLETISGDIFFRKSKEG